MKDFPTDPMRQRGLIFDALCRDLASPQFRESGEMQCTNRLREISRQLNTSAAQDGGSMGDLAAPTVAAAPAGLSHSAVSQAKPLIDYREEGGQ